MLEYPTRSCRSTQSCENACTCVPAIMGLKAEAVHLAPALPVTSDYGSL